MIGCSDTSTHTRARQACQRRRHNQCGCLGVLPKPAMAKIIKSEPSPRPPVWKVLRGSPDRRPYVPTTYVRPHHLIFCTLPTTSPPTPTHLDSTSSTLLHLPLHQRLSTACASGHCKATPILLSFPSHCRVVQSADVTSLSSVGTRRIRCLPSRATGQRTGTRSFVPIAPFTQSTSLISTKTRKANPAAALPVAVTIRSFASV